MLLLVLSKTLRHWIVVIRLLKMHVIVGMRMRMMIMIGTIWVALASVLATIPPVLHGVVTTAL